MSTFTPEKRKLFFSKRPNLVENARTEYYSEIMAQKGFASQGWKKFKENEKRELINDWKSFFSQYKSSNLICTKQQIWSNEYVDTLPGPLRPIIVDHSKIYDAKNEDGDIEDKESSYLSCCIADMDIPSIKMNIVSLLNINKFKQEIWSDTIFLNDNNRIYVTQLNSPNSLYSISIPSTETDYTLSICYHIVTRNSNVILKALQFYLSTGVSYIVSVDQTCLLKNLHTLKDTPFGFLLTDPSVRRVCWNPMYIQNAMNRQVRFTIGSCIDLSQLLKQTQISNLTDAIDYYLEDWKDKVQFHDSKRDFKRAEQPFWDKPGLPNTVKKYCAMEGWAVYSLYLKTLEAADK